MHYVCYMCLNKSAKHTLNILFCIQLLTLMTCCSKNTPYIKYLLCHCLQFSMQILPLVISYHFASQTLSLLLFICNAYSAIISVQ